MTLLKLPPYRLAGLADSASLDGGVTVTPWNVPSFEWKGRPLLVADAAAHPVLWTPASVSSLGSVLVAPDRCWGVKGCLPKLPRAVISINLDFNDLSSAVGNIHALLQAKGIMAADVPWLKIQGGAIDEGGSDFLGIGLPFHDFQDSGDPLYAGSIYAQPAAVIDPSRYIGGQCLYLLQVGPGASVGAAYVDDSGVDPAANQNKLAVDVGNHLLIPSVFQKVGWRIYYTGYDPGTDDLAAFAWETANQAVSQVSGTDTILTSFFKPGPDNPDYDHEGLIGQIQADIQSFFNL